MKDDFAKEELLSDVLAEATTPSFRASSLDHMLAVVQQRRARRRRVQGLVTAVCVLMAFGLGVRLFVKQAIVKIHRPDPLLVHSVPLSPGTIVATESGLITTVNSSGSSVVLVEAIPSQNLFEFIGDDTLFGLLAGRPAALIHHAGASAELVFLDLADVNGFQAP